MHFYEYSSICFVFYQIGNQCFQLIAALAASQASLIAFVVFCNSGVMKNIECHPALCVSIFSGQRCACCQQLCGGHVVASF